MESSSFYRNVYLLTQVVPPGKEFKKYFKEGMFDKPNTAGFIYVSHYLLSIYDDERFKKAVDWPILDKKDEGKYRNEVKDFMNTIVSENTDVEVPTVLPSHLHTASGTRFVNLMWKLSSIVLRAYLRRQDSGRGEIYMAPKSREQSALAKSLLTNVIAEEKTEIVTLYGSISEAEDRAKTIAADMAKSIESGQSEWFELKQKLKTTVANAVVHPDIKKRMADPNDSEIVELWKENLTKSLNYLRNQQDVLRELTEKSERVAAVVTSVLSSDSNCLNADNLPRINTERLLELDNLDPETQVAIHHLYEENSLVLLNLLTILKSLLKLLRVDMQKNSFPDFTDCNLQIEASTEDLRQMCSMISSIQSTIEVLESKTKSIANPPPKVHDLSFALDPEIFGTTILKSSPTIHLNANEPERYDAAERLELTPVENVHKSLFLRYRNNVTPTLPRPLARPKLIVSRINFEDSMSSTTSEKFSPRRVRPTHSATKSGQFSKLFTLGKKKGANLTATSASPWKTNTTDGSIAGDLYNMSDLKPHLTSKSSFNLSRELSTPVNSTPEKPNCTKPNHYTEKPAFNSTEIVNELTTINEHTEYFIAMGESPKLPKVEKKEENRRRHSISDLIEKYKKVRERSVNLAYLEHSGENSDDSTK